MDYERKYKLALDRAKECLQDGTITTIARDYILEIFPEFQESKDEDERIRKEIIDFVKSKGGFKGDWLTWLEKQGKQTHAELGQSEATKTSDQELSNIIKPKKIDADKIIAWLVANILDYEYYVKWFKKDFKL